MATGPGVNLGKTDFVKTYLQSHRDAGVEAVKNAWTDAGHEGTVSESLVNKMRHKLGLTGAKPARPEAIASGRTGKVERPSHSSGSTGRHAPRVARSEDSAKKISMTRQGDEGETLDELEEELDGLIQKIRDLGERPDVVKALRRARRLLVRSHEG